MMAEFLTQGFTYSERSRTNGLIRMVDGNTVFWARLNERNRVAAGQFSKAAVDWLASNTSWKRGNIHAEELKHNRSGPASGKELKWDGKAWVKA